MRCIGKYGVATCSRLLKMRGLFCKRALWKRPHSAKETYNLKEPTNRSHPIPCWNEALISKKGILYVAVCCGAQHTATTTHCNTSRHNATHCNTLQHTAAHCNTSHHTATHCNVLQHTATHCNTMQHSFRLTTTSIRIGVNFGTVAHKQNTLQHSSTHCNIIQHTAAHCHTSQQTATHCNTHCNTLQHMATHGNTWQHTATHCNTLQHTATHCNTPSNWRQLPSATHLPTDDNFHLHTCRSRHTGRQTQYAAIRCNRLQHIATHCNTLQHTFQLTTTSIFIRVTFHTIADKPPFLPPLP